MDYMAFGSFMEQIKVFENVISRSLGNGFAGGVVCAGVTHSWIRHGGSLVYAVIKNGST